MNNVTMVMLFLYGCSEAKSPEGEINEEAEQTEGEDSNTEETGTAEDGVLVVNEVSIDPADTEDWIEIYNSTDQAIDVGDWLIGDDPEEQTAISALSADTIVPADGFLVVYTKIVTSEGEELGFGLKKDGSESLFIRQGELELELGIPAMETENLTYGRIPDGTDRWENNLEPTPGSLNE